MHRAPLILTALLFGCGSETPEAVKSVEPKAGTVTGDQSPTAEASDAIAGIDHEAPEQAADSLMPTSGHEIEATETRRRQLEMLRRLEAISMKDDFDFSHSKGIDETLAMVAAYRVWEALTKHIDDPSSLDLTSVAVLLTMSRIDGSRWVGKTDYRAKNRAGALQKYHALVLLDMDPENKKPVAFDPSLAVISEIRHDPPLPHVDFRVQD